MTSAEVHDTFPTREQILRCLRDCESLGGVRPDKVVKIMGGDPTICESRLKAMADEDLVLPRRSNGHEFYTITRRGKEELLRLPRTAAAGDTPERHVCEICGLEVFDTRDIAKEERDRRDPR